MKTEARARPSMPRARSSTSQSELSRSQVTRFNRQGFLVVEDVTTSREIAALQPLYDDIVERRMGFTPQDASRVLRLRGESLLAILLGKEEIASLRRTRLLRTAVAHMARLLGTEPSNLVTGVRLFLKPAHYGETRWHQDAAYRPAPHDSVSMWVPLDSATPKTGGCLSYLPGTHKEQVVHPHHGEGEHLVLEAVDAAGEVTCPILPTAAIIHHCLTIHRAGPNRTDGPRRAIGIVCRKATS
jgi:ectoine hydroxylase-related dioxygenase (phytanoyl-CoA dioxygenase family)